MVRKTVFNASTVAALAAFVCAIVMGFGVPVPEPGVSLQPSVPPVPLSEFVRPTNEYPELALRFFAADSLFVLSYLMVFVGLYTVVVDRSRVFAGVGLGAGVLAALLDVTENAFFITYARLALNTVPLEQPMLPLIYVLANLKWMAAFAALYAFGLVWPRDSWLGRIISGLMLIFPLVGVLGIANPDMIAWRGLFFLIGMLLFAWYFWRQARKA